MYAITRRLDVPAPVFVDCDCGGGNRRERKGGTHCGDCARCRREAEGRHTPRMCGRCVSAAAVKYGPAARPYADRVADEPF